jgi:hypothetical protein
MPRRLGCFDSTLFRDESERAGLVLVLLLAAWKAGGGLFRDEFESAGLVLVLLLAAWKAGGGLEL